MSDYQKLKAKHKELKQKSKLQSLKVEHLEKLLVTILNCNKFIQDEVIRLTNLQLKQ